jgi:hypothetical protein
MQFPDLSTFKWLSGSGGMIMRIYVYFLPRARRWWLTDLLLPNAQSLAQTVTISFAVELSEMQSAVLFHPITSLFLSTIASGTSYLGESMLAQLV